MIKDADAIIIGSGIGGLANALTLARAGQKVIVLEQHYVPGGWCHSFYIQGHRFSPGVHYVGEMGVGQPASRVFEGLGLANDLTFFQQNSKGYDHCVVGDQRFNLPANKDRLVESLRLRFPAERRNIKRYLDIVDFSQKELHHISDLDHIVDLILAPIRTRHLGRYALFSLQRVIDWYLKDPYLKAFLNLQCGNHGLPPQRASFPIHAAVMGHYFNGGFYPAGGGAAVVKAFTKAIKQHGGEVITQARVQQILVEKTTGKPRAVGVQLEDGRQLFATQIVSNADPHKTYKGMIAPEFLSSNLVKKLQHTTYSAASISMFLIIEGDLRQWGLDSGNIWYADSPDLNAVYKTLEAKDPLHGERFPGMFISSPTLKDPTSYDGRYHTLELVSFLPYQRFAAYSNSPSGDRPEAYQQFKARLGEKMLRTLDHVVPGIRSAIAYSEMGTPLTNSYYVEATAGNCYGTEKIFRQIGPFSFQASAPIENLFLCGASTLAHGLMGAANSGLSTAARMLGVKRPLELLQYDETQEVKVYPAEHPESWPDWVNQKAAIKKKRTRLVLPNTVR